ncbi:MAG: hypothetical protein SOT38_00375 [Oscillospiraceae bacterium]|nr:hypothetical protein [Oscillospiraceae bacterium]
MADNEKNQFDLNGDDSGAENTDFAEENLEAEVAENAETEDTAKSDDDSQEYSSQFDELDDYISEDNPDSSKNDIAKPKKKMKTSTIITIVVIVAVVLAIIGGAVYFIFFNNTIKGIWKYTQTGTDGTVYETYYEFKDNELVLSMSTEYMSEEMTYQISYSDNSFNYMYNGAVQQSFKYEVTGNLIQGKKVTISYGTGGQTQELTYEMFKPETELKGPSFKKNDSIVGYWKTTNMYGMDSFMELTDDGFIHNYTITPIYTDVMTFKYNFDGKQIITLSSGGTDSSGNTVEAGSESKMDASVKDDKLTISNGSYDTVYEKSSKEEMDKYRDSLYDSSSQSSSTKDEAATAEDSNKEKATAA